MEMSTRVSVKLFQRNSSRNKYLHTSKFDCGKVLSSTGHNSSGQQAIHACGELVDSHLKHQSGLGLLTSGKVSGS